MRGRVIPTPNSLGRRVGRNRSQIYAHNRRQTGQSGDDRRRIEPPAFGHRFGGQTHRLPGSVVGKGARTHRPGARRHRASKRDLARQRATAAKRARRGPGLGRDAACRVAGTRNHRPQAALCSGGRCPVQPRLRHASGKREVRGGRSSVRAALYVGALVATRHNPVLRKFHHCGGACKPPWMSEVNASAASASLHLPRTIAAESVSPAPTRPMQRSSRSAGDKVLCGFKTDANNWT